MFCERDNDMSSLPYRCFMEAHDPFKIKRTLNFVIIFDFIGSFECMAGYITISPVN
jgi:hypothetical protein